MASVGTRKRTSPGGEWRSRIVEYREEPAESFLANPLNAAKLHPITQQRAMSAMLDDVGYVAPVIVNRRTGYLLDGHMRVALALDGNAMVPVCYVDLDPDEEARVLMTFDPIGSMAAFDTAMLREIVDSVPIPSHDITAMLDRMCDPRDLTGEGRDDEPDDEPEPEPKQKRERGEGMKNLMLSWPEEDYVELTARLGTVQGDSNSDKIAFLIRASTEWK